MNRSPARPARVLLGLAWVVAGAFTFGCGGGAVIDGSTTDAGGDAREAGDAGALPDGSHGASCDGGPSTSARSPAQHRVSGSACPSQRAPVTTTSACRCTASDGGACQCGSCSQDSDCTAGANGRCSLIGPVHYYECTYDECAADSDCPGTAPCSCRDSDSSAATNTCLTPSDCRTDSDCGPGGFCSPSALSFCMCPSTQLCPDSGVSCFAGSMPEPCACGDACGHGYFCHTPCDACIDDSDCGPGATCNFDTLTRQWSCSTCWPVP